MGKAQREERGAASVEFALVLPMLVLLLFGIIDFGYLLGQHNEIRHAAREGARIAAVSNADFDQDGDADFDAEDIRLFVCGALNLAGGTATVELTQSGTTVGSEASIEIVLATQSLTGAPVMVDIVPTSLASSATFRMEAPATWAVPGTPGTCP